LVELWTVVTRPLDVNGLGLSTEAARAEIERLERFFTVLRETPAVYPAWKRLVFEYQVSGKPVHDARLVSAMRVHGITSILTFNQSDFGRYAGIEVFDPAAVASGATLI
jgi:predicted nucleic acid-binding protein